MNSNMVIFLCLVTFTMTFGVTLTGKVERLLDLLNDLEKANERIETESRSMNFLKELLKRNNHCAGDNCSFHYQCCGTLQCGRIGSDGEWINCPANENCTCMSIMG